MTKNNSTNYNNPKKFVLKTMNIRFELHCVQCKPLKWVTSTANFVVVVSKCLTVEFYLFYLRIANSMRFTRRTHKITPPTTENMLSSYLDWSSCAYQIVHPTYSTLTNSTSNSFRFLHCCKNAVIKTKATIHQQMSLIVECRMHRKPSCTG